ncbi:MAG: 30S ribosomal protein S20 [Candidatus Pacebacteria bacterium]|nr:30S ribosomal protein S20 [Candidatus Paceibacterota bacterium]
MPITSSAKKTLRASKRKRVFNVRRSEEMKKVIKKIKHLILEGKKEEALALVPSVQKAIDKAAKRGILKANTAARKKSNIITALKKIS